jgi:hypothetical protein
MKVRLELQTDSRIAAARLELDSRLKELVSDFGEQFAEFCDSAMTSLLRREITSAHADEGTLWLLDPGREFLIPRFNSGENAARFINDYRQSIREGMISMVVATEQPICENEVQASEQQDKTLDKRLGLQTCAMLAVPLYYFGELRGVFSAVQLTPAGARSTETRGFSIDDLTTLQGSATVVCRLIEHRLLLHALDMEGVV